MTTTAQKMTAAEKWEVKRAEIISKREEEEKDLKKEFDLRIEKRAAEKAARKAEILKDFKNQQDAMKAAGKWQSWMENAKPAELLTEKEFDGINNDGGEGYNPHRSGLYR